MIDIADPPVDDIVQAIHTGQIPVVRNLLHDNPGMATARFCAKDRHEVARTLMHVATDPPGHYPHAAETIAVLAAAGAELNVPCTGPFPETALHWAASSNDVEALDALLDAGADIEAPGASFDGGTPLADAVGFRQWAAARRLIDRGARTTLGQAAAMGLRQRIVEYSRGIAAVEELNDAFWYACHGGQLSVAAYFRGLGANPDWIPSWSTTGALEAARQSQSTALVRWLQSLTARPGDGWAAAT
ncbi:ankyrin repeat domain-containing protein [Arthrobacter sp. 35W]|uniref:ankyrin repeat domain-containing protein n=1 Tax=Arthrobacter sp. 35W TaxID=1132441 RepID=UPI00041C0423|nr:ankyrin repeat domain-containing protein [Arthrobacter sp. 35W]